MGDTHTLHLYVSNQSFDIDPVRIEISIDGTTQVAETFEVLGQHNWVLFDVTLTAGEHVLEATAFDGEATLSETFEVEGETWAVVEFWTEPERQVEPFLRWVVQTKPIYFA